MRSQNWETEFFLLTRRKLHRKFSEWMKFPGRMCGDGTGPISEKEVGKFGIKSPVDVRLP